MDDTTLADETARAEEADAGETFSQASLSQRPQWQRLENQLAWYGRRSRHCQRWHKGLRVLQVSFAAAIPVISLAEQSWARWSTAILGALIAVLEAIEQINQFGPQWIQYRSTAETLKHEKYLLLAAAGPYRELSREEALRLLAERVEERVSQEHARWVSHLEKEGARQRNNKDQKSSGDQKTNEN